MRGTHVSYIDEIVALEDKKFLDIIDETLAFAKAMAERRRWRDGHGVMHELKPFASASINTGKPFVAGWCVSCNYKRRSTVEHDPASVVTCLQCVALDG